MASIPRVSDSEFEQRVMQSDRLTVVDFNAPWCGPCKKLTPILEEIARDYDGKIQVVEVDVGEAPQTASRFGVVSIPQVLFIRDGKVRETMVGLNPKPKIVKKIEQHLAG